MTVWIVPNLECEPPLERLPVAEPGLGLDPGAPRLRLASADLGVPRAEITVDRQRHLGPPTESGVEPPAKSLEQRELRPIADRIASRIGPDREVEPDDRTPSTELGDRDSVQLTALEPDQLLVRRPRSRGCIANAESGADAGQSMVLSNAPECGAAAPAPSIGGTLAGTHAEDRLIRPFTRPSLRIWSARGTNRRTGDPLLPAPGGLAASWSSSRTDPRRNGFERLDPGLSFARWSDSRTKSRGGER